MTEDSLLATVETLAHPPAFLVIMRSEITCRTKSVVVPTGVLGLEDAYRSAISVLKARFNTEENLQCVDAILKSRKTRQATVRYCDGMMSGVMRQVPSTSAGWPGSARLMERCTGGCWYTGLHDTHTHHVYECDYVIKDGMWNYRETGVA